MGAHEPGAETVDVAADVRLSKVGKTLRNDGGSVRLTLYQAMDMGWRPDMPVKVKYLDDGRIIIDPVGETPEPVGGETDG